MINERKQSISSRQLNRVLAAFLFVVSAPVFAHHEAIFGPQSATMISRRRFVSAQYYRTNEGQLPAAKTRSDIAVLTVGLPVGEQWSVSATLPAESVRSDGQPTTTGTQDIVFGIRRGFDLWSGGRVLAVATVEPPTTGNLEHRAVGLGGGALYMREWTHFSAVAYALGRTENSLEQGERRGNRLFVGSGIAYEREGLRFGPQLGVSWEMTGRSTEGGATVSGSESSVIFVHPTLVVDVAPSAQMFTAVSLPVAQWSGDEGWQRWRFATGLIWSF